MNFKPRKANVAQSMGGYLWAVCSLVGEKMQVRCLTETHVEVIKPPLQVIHIGNGCEGYSPSIKIPAKSELTSQNDIAERTTYFLDFNAQYEKSKDMALVDLGGARPACAPPFAWHPSSLADLGGRTRCVPPNLPGILVFDDILGHIV